MIATTIVQCSKLISLGVDFYKTADMFYKISDSKIELICGSYSNYRKEDSNLNYIVIPAWSLEALLNLLPRKHIPVLTKGSCFPIDNDDYYCYLDDDELYNETDCNFMHHSKNAIDAVFQTVVEWLKFQNKK